MAYLYMLVWNIFVLSGAVYLVLEKGWSPWWIVLSLLLLISVKS